MRVKPIVIHVPFQPLNGLRYLVHHRHGQNIIEFASERQSHFCTLHRDNSLNTQSEMKMIKGICLRDTKSQGCIPQMKWDFAGHVARRYSEDWEENQWVDQIPEDMEVVKVQK